MWQHCRYGARCATITIKWTIFCKMLEDSDQYQKPPCRTDHVGAKSAPSRYFHSPVPEEEVKAFKLKSVSQQNFSGEVIKVEQDKQIAFKKTFHRKRAPTKHIKPGTSDSEAQAKIPKERLKKYDKGEKVRSKGVKTKFFKEKQQRKEVYLQYATEQAARTELLLTEQQGFIEPDEEEITAQYRQVEIGKNVSTQI